MCYCMHLCIGMSIVHRICQNMHANIVEYMIQVVSSCVMYVKNGSAMVGEIHQGHTLSIILSEPNTR